MCLPTYTEGAHPFFPPRRQAFPSLAYVRVEFPFWHHSHSLWSLSCLTLVVSGDYKLTKKRMLFASLTYSNFPESTWNMLGTRQVFVKWRDKCECLYRWGNAFCSSLSPALLHPDSAEEHDNTLPQAVGLAPCCFRVSNLLWHSQSHTLCPLQHWKAHPVDFPLQLTGDEDEDN